MIGLEEILDIHNSYEKENSQRAAFRELFYSIDKAIHQTLLLPIQHFSSPEGYETLAKERVEREFNRWVELHPEFSNRDIYTYSFLPCQEKVYRVEFSKAFPPLKTRVPIDENL